MADGGDGTFSNATCFIDGKNDLSLLQFDFSGIKNSDVGDPDLSPTGPRTDLLDPVIEFATRALRVPFQLISGPVAVDAGPVIKYPLKLPGLERNIINLSVDPRFIRPVCDGTGDFHLMSNSPVIDKGANSTTDSRVPGSDFDGHARPIGVSTDIGADEVKGGRS